MAGGLKSGRSFTRAKGLHHELWGGAAAVATQTLVPSLGQYLGNASQSSGTTWTFSNAQVQYAGDTLLVVVGYDNTGGRSVSAVHHTAGTPQADLTLLATQVCGGSAGLTLKAYVSENQPASTGTVDVVFDGTAPNCVLAYANIRSVKAVSDDVVTKDSDSSDVVTLVPASDTSTAPEVIVGFVLVAGSAFADGSEPTIPADFTPMWSLASLAPTATGASLYGYSRQVSTADSYGLATTLSASRDWAGLLVSFR